MSLPEYVYVASSWRNPLQPALVEVLTAAGIPHYDFRNPEGGTGFSWSEVKTEDGPSSIAVCQHCGHKIARGSYVGLGFFDLDVDPANDPVIWRHTTNGYAACAIFGGDQAAIPKKGSDWEARDEYLRMVEHPRAIPVEPELMYRMVDHMATSVVDLLGWLGVED